jgi:L-amino acid N-acyltransferase YncA
MIAIRPARPDDAATIAAIYRHNVDHGTATFDTEAPDPAATAAKIAQVAAAGWPWLVGVAGAEIIGYAYATQIRPRAAYLHTAENSIYLAPHATGRGHGRALLTALLAASTAAGFRQMIAVIGDAAPASMALHRALGFREVGRLTAVGWKFGRWLDVVYMQRALGE